ncbi:MAG: hypothetical protein J6T24_02090 [Clostridia bacterium]|nr:hypothetical protein [Clostridia bacterium]
MKAIGIQGKYLEYKGKPLVRQGNELYYGDMSDPYYLFLMIMGEKEEAGLGVKIPDKVMIQVLATADNKMLKQKVVDGLYEAFDLGTAWLERANK